MGCVFFCLLNGRVVCTTSRCGELKKAARVLREMIALGSVMQQGWKWTTESYIRVGEKINRLLSTNFKCFLHMLSFDLFYTFPRL